MTTSSDICSPEQVRAHCEALGFLPCDEALKAMSEYLALLQKWNKAMNLVGPASWQDMLATLLIDSFHLAPFVAALQLPPQPRCWDLGSGAGLPGLPLRMLWQEGEYTLVEAREKRALFLRTVLASRPLPGVTVFQGRVEQFMRTRPSAQMIVSRAFMPWEKLLHLVAPYMAPQGFCVFLALTPLPSSLPPGWTAAAEKGYTAAGSTRYFWAVQRSL